MTLYFVIFGRIEWRDDWYTKNRNGRWSKPSQYIVLWQEFTELHEESQRETSGQLVFLPRFERCNFRVQCRSNTARTNVLVIERSNDKRTVMEGLTFRNRWLGASWIAGCIISVIQLLSLHDEDFLERKNCWTLNRVCWRSDNAFPL
jgi:hypothetical protein